MTVLPFPTNRVCPLGPDADSPRIASVAELLTAMEAASWRSPRVVVARGIDRISRIHVAIPCVEAYWTPAQARIAADTLEAEQAFAGAAGLAATLRAAAAAVDRRSPAGGPLTPGQRRAPHGTGGRFILAALIIAACVAAAWAFDALT